MERIVSQIRKNSFEKLAWGAKTLTCGLDEVGRGCLAGPVVTAAVMLSTGKTCRLIKDSKVMTELQRLKAYEWIMKNGWFGVGVVDHHCIDKHNIWRATLICMKKALIHLLAICPQRPSSILVDAMPLQLFDTDYNSIPVYYFVKGESKSISIAAASIVAKVTRDEIMKKFDVMFPGFYLDSHKGYGTEKHKNALRECSPLIIHRKTFLKDIDTVHQPNQEDEFNEQQSICK